MKYIGAFFFCIAYLTVFAIIWLAGFCFIPLAMAIMYHNVPGKPILIIGCVLASGILHMYAFKFLDGPNDLPTCKSEAPDLF